MGQPRILFAGGGGEQDSRPLDELFAAWVGPQGQAALSAHSAGGCSVDAGGHPLAAGVFAPLGLARIDAWTDLAGKTAQDLQSYDAVYIGGGNTFYLLH